MHQILLALFTTVILYFLFKSYRKSLTAQRERLIDTYQFPPSLAKKVAGTYPHLSAAQVDHVLRALREYFHCCNVAGRRMVAMPSQVVDVAWHEFILSTRHYQHFCKKALGRFLHHTPAEAMSSPTQAQKGIKTAWRVSCHRENMAPKKAHQLPMLFAIDSLLDIPDGFHYSLNCTSSGANGYCAGHIGCGSGCAGGCSGGCGGDSGCGGGCGGD